MRQRAVLSLREYRKMQKRQKRKMFLSICWFSGQQEDSFQQLGNSLKQYDFNVKWRHNANALRINVKLWGNHTVFHRELEREVLQNACFQKQFSTTFCLTNCDYCVFIMKTNCEYVVFCWKNAIDFLISRKNKNLSCRGQVVREQSSCFLGQVSR